MTGLLNCGECGVGFHGRSDARYCSSACRQRAHRGRTAQRVAALAEHQRSRPHRQAVLKPDLAVVFQRAHQEQRRARELCRAAVDAQRRALAAQRLSARRPSATRVVAPPPPWLGLASIDSDTAGRP